MKGPGLNLLRFAKRVLNDFFLRNNGLLLTSAVAHKNASRLTRLQLAQIESRMHELDADPSTLEDAALKLGALNWNLFFRSQQDTPCKLLAERLSDQNRTIAADLDNQIDPSVRANQAISAFSSR